MKVFWMLLMFMVITLVITGCDRDVNAPVIDGFEGSVQVNSTNVSIVFGVSDDRSEILVYNLWADADLLLSGQADNDSVVSVSVVLPYRREVVLNLEVVDDWGNSGFDSVSVLIGDLLGPSVIISSVTGNVDEEVVGVRVESVVIPLNVSNCSCFVRPHWEGEISSVLGGFQYTDRSVCNGGLVSLNITLKNIDSYPLFVWTGCDGEKRAVSVRSLM